jgi:hypothetical protein
LKSVFGVEFLRLFQHPFDRTYEGLKSGVGGAAHRVLELPFDRTYEGLKLGVVRVEVFQEMPF